MTEPEHVIVAICNDPRHARDKVAKIKTFGRFTWPSGEVRWLIRGDDGGWHYTPPDSDRVYRRYHADTEKGSTYTWPCNLCPRTLRVREDTLHQVLEDTYRGLQQTRPGERVSRVPIEVLRRVASKRPQ